MKYLCSFLFVLLIISLKSQTINIISVEQKNQKIYINYNLTGTQNKYDIKIYVKSKLSYSWSDALISVYGDVGPDQKVGYNKQIIWDVLKDRDGLTGEWIFGMEAVSKKTKTNKDIYSTNNPKWSFSSYVDFFSFLKSGIQFNRNYNSEVTFDSEYNESINKIIPIGLKFVSGNDKDFRFSFDFNYSKCNYDFEYESFSSFNNYSMNIEKSIFRASLFFEFHNSKKSDKYYEPYTIFGFGYKQSNYIFESTNPDFELEENYWLLGNTTFRFAKGFNFYLSDNLGILLEIGIGGGGMLRTGLIYRGS